MILIKSIFAGLVLLIVTAVFSLVAAIIAFTVFVERQEGTAVGIDPISVMRNAPILWVVGLVVFLLGFFWEFRRASYQ